MTMLTDHGKYVVNLAMNGLRYKLGTFVHTVIFGYFKILSLTAYSISYLVYRNRLPIS